MRLREQFSLASCSGGAAHLPAHAAWAPSRSRPQGRRFGPAREARSAIFTKFGIATTRSTPPFPRPGPVSIAFA